MTEEQMLLWKQKKYKCEACGNIMPIGDAFCDKCGTAIPKIPIPIGNDDFRKIKNLEIILFISFALLLCVIVVFPVSIYSVHENLTFHHSENFDLEKALIEVTIALTVILIFVNIMLVIAIRILSKRYWDIICTNPNVIIEQRNLVISLDDRKHNSQISTKIFENQRKALSQIIYDTMLKIYL